MKVGLVADTFSVERGTGIARYCQEILSGLSGLGLDVEPIGSSAPQIPFGTVVDHTIGMPYRILRRASGLDIIHATSPICALGFPLLHNSRLVITYHDLTSLLCQDTSSAFHTGLFAPLFLRIGRFADRIIADSTQTKDEMVAHLGISRAKIAVVNLGVDGRFAPIKRETRDGYTIGYIGALNRRKRLDHLLHAFHRLKKKHSTTPVRLVICGSKRLEYPSLVMLSSELDLTDDVEFRGFVAEDALVETYNSFDVFVLPSEWEGFGLPILEAQRCGVPVIICEGAHIPAEVARCCLRATSEENMADTIHQLLTDSDLRRRTVEEGLEYSQRFTWERMVKETVEVYEEVMC